jgi:hypothetical protein
VVGARATETATETETAPTVAIAARLASPASFPPARPLRAAESPFAPIAFGMVAAASWAERAAA